MGSIIKMSMDDDYISDYDYPPGYIQGGEMGIVIVKGGQNYRTAFVEFFPETGGFIRGEGKTVKDAEKSLLEKITLQDGCPGHEYTPKHYTNGVGFCKHCGQMKSHAFTAADLEQYCRDCGSPTGVESGRRTRQGNFVCDDHDELLVYQEMLHYINWDYEGEEDLVHSPIFKEFEENRLALRDIVFEEAEPNASVLNFFRGVKARAGSSDGQDND